MRRISTTLLLLVPPLLWGCGGDEGKVRVDKDPKTTANPVQARGANIRRTTGEVARDSAAVPQLSELPAGPWTALAERITTAGDLDQAIAATREALARGGVPTVDGDQTLVDAIGPAAGFFASPVETIHLALEARHRRSAGRMTAAELGQMLQSFGWPFRPGEGRARDPEQDWADRQPRGQLEIPDSAQPVLENGAAAPTPAETETGQAALEAVRAEAEAARNAFTATQKTRVAAQRAVATAPAAEKEAAKARAAEALAAHQAAFEAMKAAQKAETEQLRALQSAERDAVMADQAVFEEAREQERIRRRIGPDYAAGAQVIDLLTTWIREAAKDPNHPSSFTPLFIAEMAKRQDPPVDLSAGPYIRMGRGEGPPVDLLGAPQSEQLRLSLLELELFAAAFYRDRMKTGAIERHPGRRGPGEPTPIVLAGLSPAVQDPCSDLLKNFGALGEAGRVGAREGGQRALREAVRRATDGGTAQAFGRALSAVGTVAKIWKMVAFYSDAQVAVSVSHPSVHKPPPGETHAVRFDATVGVNESDWKAYQRLMGGEAVSRADRAVRDCLRTAGVPVLTDLGDIAKDAESWLVEWRLVEGSPRHATIPYRVQGHVLNHFFLPGRLAMKLKPAGPYGASTGLVVQLALEDEAKHPRRFTRGYVVAEAAVDAAQPPSVLTIVKGLKGAYSLRQALSSGSSATSAHLALADILVELTAGWIQALVLPRARASVEVTFCCERPFFRAPTEGTPVSDGGGEGDNECLLDQAAYIRMRRGN